MRLLQRRLSLAFVIPVPQELGSVLWGKEPHRQGTLLVALLCPVHLHASDVLLVLQDAKFAVVLEEDLDISVDFFR